MSYNYLKDESNIKILKVSIKDYDLLTKRGFVMNENKLQIINKLFNNSEIRSKWDKEEEKYYISVIDIVNVLAQSKDGRKYWNKLKQRFSQEGNETVTKCHQLKLKAKDGKRRMTDVVNINDMFRIIESIPSKNAEPIKQWLAKLAREDLEKTVKKTVISSSNNLDYQYI